MSKLDFSIIIPVYNDLEGITKTINSLLDLEYDKNNFELLIIDNRSTDNTLRIIQNYANKYPNLIKPLCENKIKSSYAARNIGIENANGTTLVFMDADMTCEKDFLNELKTYINDKNADYVGYNVEIMTSKNPNFFERYDKLTAFPVEDYLKYRHFAPTCALAVKKEVFDKVGKFMEVASSGDYEFGNRVSRSGIKQRYADEITVFHPARKTLKSHIKKTWRVGQGRGKLRKQGIDLKNESTAIMSSDKNLPITTKLFQSFLLIPKTAGYMIGRLG